MATDNRIMIPEITRQRLLVTITGLTPLITNKPPKDIFDDNPAAKGKVKKQPLSADERFTQALYTLEEESYGFPSAGIKKAMVLAGGRFTDEKMTELRGMFSVTADLLPIVSPNPPRLRKDLAFANRKPMPAYRPEFWPWSIDIPIIYTENFISRSQVINLLRLAGTSVGIGSWRVENNGNHGQFEITQVQAIEYEETL